MSNTRIGEVIPAGVEANDAFQSIIPIISKEFENMPDGKQILEKLIQRFTSMFEDPPQQDFEFFACKRFALDEIRITLFRPLPDQVTFFSRGLLAGLNAPKDHSLKKTSSLLLTLIYLVHRKNLDFVKEFIINDGFEALIEYLDVENLYERSQAMETLMSLTDCDFFDWFAAPTTTEHQQIHLKLITILTSLTTSNNQNYFIEKLIKNRASSYPGGSLRALQLLAFWLSWIRALYTEDHRLVLSSKLLAEIKQWSQPYEQLINEGSEEGENEDELKLAQTLYEDFSEKQFENLTQAERDSFERIPNSNDTLTVSGVQKPEFQEGLPALQSLDIKGALESKPSQAISSPTFEVTPTIDVALKYKAEGNDHYKAEKYDLALKSYQYAMNTAHSLQRSKASLETEEDFESLVITLHTNIANTIWKIWTGEEEAETTLEKLDADKSRSNDIQVEQFFEDIKFHCEEVLRLSPNHVKAMYRLANAYIKKQQLKTAYTLITTFMKQLANVSSSVSNSLEDTKLFDRLKRKCIALQIYQLSSEDAEFVFEEWNFTVYDMIYLKSLLKRLQVSEVVLDKLTISLSKLPSQEKVVGHKKSAKMEENADEQSFTTNQDLLQEIPRQQDMITHKAPKSQVKILKMKSSDRKLVTQLRTIGKTIKESYEAKTPLEELEGSLRSGFEVIKELWSHDLKLKDIYGSLIDENDLLHLFSLLDLVLTPITDLTMKTSFVLSYKEWIGGSEVMKVLEQLLKCERIQSIVFSMKYDYQELFIQLKQLTSQLLNEEHVKAIKGNQKLLQQFLTLIS